MHAEQHEERAATITQRIISSNQQPDATKTKTSIKSFKPKQNKIFFFSFSSFLFKEEKKIYL